MATRVVCHDGCCDDKEVRIKCVPQSTGGVDIIAVDQQGRRISSLLNINENGVWRYDFVADVGIDMNAKKQINARN